MQERHCTLRPHIEPTASAVAFAGYGASESFPSFRKS